MDEGRMVAVWFWILVGRRLLQGFVSGKGSLGRDIVVGEEERVQRIKMEQPARGMCE